MKTMIRISKEEALAKIEALEKSRLDKLTKEELIQRAIDHTMGYVEDLNDSQISNRLAILSNGEFALEY